MMKRGRQRLSLFLCGALVCMALGGCGSRTSEASGSPEKTAAPEASPIPTGEENELERRVLSDWSAYLVNCEYLYGDMLWAISYIKGFEKEPTWENLQYARMAFYTAESYIQKRDLPEMEVTYEEYDQLMQEEKDLSFVQPAMEYFTEDRDSVLLHCRGLRYRVDSEVFWKHNLTPLFQSADVRERMYECELRYLAVETEYLLSALGDAGLTERFHAFWEENCPRTASYRTGGSMDELEEAGSACVDELEELTAEMSEVLGQSQAALDLLADAVASGDLDILTENAVKMEDLPILFPFPDWYEEETVRVVYYWEEADGSHSYPSEGDVLERTPDGCIMECPDVDKQELADYRDNLERCGFPCEDTQDTGNLLGVTYRLGEPSLTLIWSEEENNVTISMKGSLACFVPGWYFTSAVS